MSTITGVVPMRQYTKSFVVVAPFLFTSDNGNRHEEHDKEIGFRKPPIMILFIETLN